MTDVNCLKQYVSQLKPSILGRFIYYCLPYRRQIVLDNMRRAFSEILDEPALKKLAQSFYCHMVKSIKENIVMKFMSEKKMIECIEIKDHEAIIKLCKDHGGVIILTGHLGNWEFAPIAGIRKFKEFQGRFHIIRKNLSHKWLEKIAFKQYNNAGINVIPKDNALNPICQALEQQDAVIFVMDQHACVQSKDGIPVEFFGEKAGTYRSLAVIARISNIPVVPAACYRKKDGKHIMQFYPPLKWINAEKSHQELYLNTLLYNQTLEKMILAHPEQWLWLHKRWKLVNE